MNSIQLIGAVVETDLRYTPNGKPILEITLGGVTNNAPWYQRVTIFGRNAERYAEVAAGTVMHVHGRLQQDRWQGKDGTNRSAVKVIADGISILAGEFAFEADKRGQQILAGGMHAVTLAGNATRDVEVRHTPNGDVANASLAVNKRKRVNDEWVDDPQYFDLSAWSDTAAYSHVASVRKGEGLLVRGTLRNRSWEGEDGRKRYKTEVQVAIVHRVVKPDAAPVSKRIDIDDEYPSAETLPF